MAKRIKPTGPISYKRGKGLMVSMHCRAPRTADEKVTVAKSIVQAALAAHDSGELEDKNYDIHWPLSMVIDLLEQASAQMGGAHE
jgi:hypothetical protein